jgi:spore maturation protein CgeB
MKIAIIGAINYDSLEFHLKDELSQQGHTAEIFDYDKLVSKKIDFGLTQISMSYVENKNKKLLKQVLEYKPDLVIGIYRHIHPEVVKNIKNERIKIIHINPDGLTTFQNQQLFVEPYDAYFSKDPYMVKFMKDKLELNVFQYQEAFNPRIHKKPEKPYKELENEVDIDVLSFGNLYPYRNRMLSSLKDKGLEITIYGHKAKYFDPYLNENYKNRGIYGEEKARILNGSKIVFNNFHYAEIESVNNKFFEITGSGAFQICDYKPILNKILPIDPKKISFNTLNEANDLMEYYLKNPEKRWEIRQTLQKYFQENYTYKHLLEEIFEKL